MDHLLLPFRQFVLKVHSRCDLACNHCYIYEHSDQSWRGRPLGIAPETAAQAAGRIAEHATRHQLRDVHVVLHGGEPLLLGLEGTRRLLELLKRTVETEVTRLDLRIHTNAVLLDEAFLDLFATHDVKVGVSLDGDRASNDRHRLYRDGRSSYDKVVKALGLLRSAKYRQLYAGLLCTIDIANDPVDVYRGLLEQEPPRIDLLLPHATWEHLPPGLGTPRSRRRRSPSFTRSFSSRPARSWSMYGKTICIEPAMSGFPGHTLYQQYTRWRQRCTYEESQRHPIP